MLVLSWKPESFPVLPPLSRHMMPFEGGNCHLTMPVLKGRGTHDPLSEIPMVWVFDHGKNRSTMMKHVKMNLRKLCCSFWYQWVIKTHRNAASDGNGGHGVMCLPSLHTRLLDTGLNWARCYGKNWCHFTPKPTVIVYIATSTTLTHSGSTFTNMNWI